MRIFFAASKRYRPFQSQNRRLTGFQHDEFSTFECRELVASKFETKYRVEVDGQVAEWGWSGSAYFLLAVAGGAALRCRCFSVEVWGSLLSAFAGCAATLRWMDRVHAARRPFPRPSVQSVAFAAYAVLLAGDIPRPHSRATETSTRLLLALALLFSIVFMGTFQVTAAAGSRTGNCYATST